MTIIDFLFPRKCLNCGKEDGYIGVNCLSQVSTVKPICPICERPSIDGMTHSGCKTPLGIDALTSIWVYEGVVRKAILALKYKYATEVAKDLSKVFIKSLLATDYLLPAISVLVPIPMHWYRENYRGFNQSEEIGKIVAQDLGWKLTSDLLVKKKSTTPQTDLKARDRSKNIQGVFSPNPRYQPLTISHKQLILFDDVWTTGSTMKEAAKVLKRGGVERVWGLTIAR